MFENIMKFFKKVNKKDEEKNNKDTAKERLHLVLMQDRANVSADFLDMMKQEIIDVIKKYIDVDEGEIDVKLTNKQNSDGTTGAPALYANIPIKSIKNEGRQIGPQEVSDAKSKKQEEEKQEEHLDTKENKNETKNSKKKNKKNKNKENKIVENTAKENDNKDIEKETPQKEPIEDQKEIKSNEKTEENSDNKIEENNEEKDN